MDLDLDFALLEVLRSFQGLYSVNYSLRLATGLPNEFAPRETVHRRAVTSGFLRHPNQRRGG